MILKEKSGRMKYRNLLQDSETRRLMNELIKRSENEYIAANTFEKIFEEGFTYGINKK